MRLNNSKNVFPSNNASPTALLQFHKAIYVKETIIPSIKMVAISFKIYMLMIHENSLRFPAHKTSTEIEINTSSALREPRSSFSAYFQRATPITVMTSAHSAVMFCHSYQASDASPRTAKAFCGVFEKTPVRHRDINYIFSGETTRPSPACTLKLGSGEKANYWLYLEQRSQQSKPTLGPY
jgi:hypothetical protein